ncbi:metallophosphoesterase, partial [bacterium]|nr:metallophosphoesterase [bacterium]
GIQERFGDVDLILSAGDLPGEYLGYITSMLNRPIISVAGNHDHEDRPAQNPFTGFPSLDLAGGGGAAELGRVAFGIRKEAGVSVLGIPGSMLYNKGPNQYSDGAMRFRLLLLAPKLLLRRLFTGRGVDIILAHSPPKGIHDGQDRCHQGFAAFRWLIALAAPAYFIHGHVHLYDGRELRERKLGRTTVVNVYGHRVLTLTKEK